MRKLRLGGLAMATAALVAAVLAFVALGPGARANTPGPTLDSVNSALLAEEGIVLETATQTATVSQADAEVDAVALFPGSTVSQAILVGFSDTHVVPSIDDRLAWAVSLDQGSSFRGPSYGPGGGSAATRAPASFFVVFIDAQTGDLIEGTTGS